jgi:hypothetical protein
MQPWDLLVEISGPRVERQTHTECLLPRRTFGSLEGLGDLRGVRFLSGECFQRANLCWCPLAALRCFLNHLNNLQFGKTNYL